MSDSIQHKPTFAFDESSERVPVVWPEDAAGEDDREIGMEDERRVALEVFARIMGTLLRSEDPKALVQVLGFKLRLADAAHSVPELAARLGVSRRTAYNKLDAIADALHTEDPAFAALFAPKP